ncbi:MAG: cupin domain-containing protein [Deltaproteobacteria bacterium]|nr:cupin domain-containing protein [Deltaproteobacteria bacterium]
MDAKKKEQKQMKYFYRLDEEESVNVGGNYSTATGPLVSGERIQVSLAHKAAGTGAKPHTHPNEQFNYLLKGKLKAMVNGQEQLVTAGTLIHIPANAVHATVATTDGDVIFLAIKDMSWGIAGTAVDADDPGPYYEPGFEPDKKVSR